MKSTNPRRHPAYLCAIALLLASCAGSKNSGTPDLPQAISRPSLEPATNNAIVHHASGRSGWISRAFLKADKPNAYTWTKFKFASPPPYGIRTNVRYFNGTVPVVLEPANHPSSKLGALFALLNHTDKNGDYAVYVYSPGGLHLWTSVGQYMSSIQADAATAADWGITKSGYIWSDYLGNSSWKRYFPEMQFSSLAVHAPQDYPPNGFLFATSRSGKYCMPSYPCGHALLAFVPRKWPKGTWKNTGWGAYQVAADPYSYDNEVVVLDEHHDVWEILPVIRSGSFEGYLPVQLETVKCSGKTIGFEEVAAFDDIFLGLDDIKGGQAVWYYSPHGQCWYPIGSKKGFTSIASDAIQYSSEPSVVWAVDGAGNVWYAH